MAELNLTSAVPHTDCGTGRQRGRIGWLIAAGILAAALLGVKSTGRAFRYALLAGLVSTLVWNYGLGKPFGFEGAIVGTLCNFVVFALCTRAYRRYRSQTLRVWKTR